MKNNSHTRSIEDITIQATVVKLDQLLRLVEDYVTPLTPRRRHDLLKMGPKTLEFVEKCVEFAEANPHLRPPFLDMEEFKLDFADAHGLYLSVNKARQLLENLADTQMTAGSEAYQSALIFYNVVKSGAANEIPGAKAVFEELSKRFPGRKHRRAMEVESAS
jgi:hypothetical protein